MYLRITQGKHYENTAYSNILKISPSKTESLQIKILIFFYIAAQIDCGNLLVPKIYVFEQK